MKNPTRVVLMVCLAAVGALALTNALAAKPERLMLPSMAGVKAACPEDGTYHPELHGVTLEGLGTFQERSVEGPSQIMVELETPIKSRNGLKTVPFTIVSIAGKGFADGLGETQFRLDASRPVTSAIWEKRAGTEFPAIQEMRFHFFYTIEALPGKVFRSVNPAVMRSDHVLNFPPPPGTVYKLVRPVEIEDVAQPGVVVGRIVSNKVIIPGPGAERVR